MGSERSLPAELVRAPMPLPAREPRGEVGGVSPTWPSTPAAAGGGSNSEEGHMVIRK